MFSGVTIIRNPNASQDVLFQVDREVNRFINHLKKKGLYDESRIIITSDHGMSLMKSVISGISWKRLVYQIIKRMSLKKDITSKMNRMLSQLRKGHLASGDSSRVDLNAVLESVVSAQADNLPVPEYSNADENSEMNIIANEDRLSDVIGHLVQNAQDATPDNGFVRLKLLRDNDFAVVEIQDNGCGMDAIFQRERLFRPFDTTKGNAGMGIGVYESREFIHGLGGQLDVRSVLGEGTTFTIHLNIEKVSKQEHSQDAENLSPATSSTTVMR